MENQLLDTQASLRFPTQQNLSDSFLKDNFWKCNFTSTEDPLHYWIILPNSLKPTSLEKKEVKGLGLKIIGEYTRIDDSPYLEVTVAYEFCQYEMNASDWLQKKLYQMGEQIIEYREIKGKSTGKYLDILTYKKMPSGDQVISRFTCLKDYDKYNLGANYLCVKASCMMKDYNELADYMLQIATNWDLINKSDWQMAETLIPFDFELGERILFYYPTSWEVGVEKDSQKIILKHDVKNENKGVKNLITYPIASQPNANLILDNYRANFKEIESLKFELDSLEEIQNINPFLKRVQHTSGTIENSLEKLTASIHIYIFQTNFNWYLLSNVGPRPNLENHFWEINNRASELILASFNNLNFQIAELKNLTQTTPTEKPFRTHEDKNYTQEEWERHEAEQWKKFKDKE